MASTAVSSELISRVVGYGLQGADFSESTPNLPMRIALLGPANTNKQTDLPSKKQLTSVQDAIDLTGAGSPMHHVMRVLRPSSGIGIGGIPVIAYPQANSGSPVAKIINLAISGTYTTGSVQHTVKINGRDNFDGQFFRFTITQAIGADLDDVATLIADAVNAVEASPVTAVAGTASVIFTAKYQGLLSNDIDIEIETGGDSRGLTYAFTVGTAGSGVLAVTPSLNLFSSDWNTIVINTYGMESTVLAELNAFNGRPKIGNNSPTGRYNPIDFKPFIAVCGSTSSTGDGTVTDAMSEDLTIEVAPAPNSPGMPFEAAANWARLLSRQAQDNPHLDITNQTYPDMPMADGDDIGTTFPDYLQRDALLKLGNSTVDLLAGAYRIQDPATTYHRAGENPPQYRYTRNLIIDWNVRYSYYLLEQLYVMDHAILADSDFSRAERTIKPKQWKAIVFELADDLAKRGLIADPQFMKDSVVVNISATNPDRFETFFQYKRSGYARVASTTAEAGFNFGTL